MLQLPPLWEEALAGAIPTLLPLSHEAPNLGDTGPHAKGPYASPQRHVDPHPSTT